VREDVEGLEVCYAQCVGEIDVHVEAQGAENAVFGREEGGTAALIGAFGDVVGF
jgi:hypothetical protein